MSIGRLVMFPAVGVVPEGGLLRVDTKFATGLAMHQKHWRGEVEAVVCADPALTLPFSKLVTPGDLPVRLTVVDDLHPRRLRELMAGASVVLASGDRHDQSDLAILGRAANVPVVYAVEYTFQARLRTAMVDRGRSLLRRARSVAWLLGDERRRRKAFSAAAALQFNGYPAERAYGRLNRDHIIYFDGRMTAQQLAGPDQMAARRRRLASGAPLRIVTSGRLEPMKGAQDILPFARALAAEGRAFQLDIFGAGSLAPEIEAEIAKGALPVRLHAPVDFDSVLVPFMRDQADVFLSCHRQGDPSCSYLEAMGCGLPVFGTRNEMWSEMCHASGGGWAAPPGRPAEAARRIASLAAVEIADAADRALAFARSHTFEAEFQNRMDHLARVARRGH